METTARLGLPLLAAAQAAKEMTVNEALTQLDAATQPVVSGEADMPPASPEIGEGWLIGASPSGAFAGNEGAIAVWTMGGWRFVTPFEGMAVWRRDAGLLSRRISGVWVNGAAVNVLTSGAIVDTEARAAIETIVARLRAAGITAA